MHPHRRRAAIVATCVLAGAALFAVLAAFVTRQLICFGDAGTSCRLALMGVQLAVAVGGLVPAAMMVRAAVRGQRRAMLAWLATAAVIYLGWGVLNDAAVHGWNNLGVF
jgi:hypothetical protein